MADAREPLTQRERYTRRKAALWAERSSWMSHWQEISQYLLPRAGRFLSTTTNRGDKRHQNIYDSSATKSLRIMSAGLMAGMTSPARPWFRLTTSDPDLAEVEAVRLWLHKVTRLMRLVFDRSNTYRTLHGMYEELGAFATACTVIEENFDNVIHHYPQTIGEYALAADREGVINTLGREFEMTVDQMVRSFGLDNVSHTVRNLYNTHALDAWVPVCHIIQPRDPSARDSRKRDPKNMPFESVYLELGADSALDRNQMLRVSGYRRFPALTPRWSAVGGDIYGSGPGMDALGDIKQLQHQQLKKAKAIEYMADPPVQVPSAMRGQEDGLLPGGVVYSDVSGQNGVRSAFDVNLNLQHLLLDIQDVRGRISSTFYADLFMMIANDTRSNITAREIAERHEEKLLMLGPVLERLHNELLGPKIDITFDRMVEARMLPPPPPELSEQELKVEFVSVLAQAQRAVGLGSVDRLIGTVGAIGNMQLAAGREPDALDKLNTDQIVDAYAEMLGVDPDMIVADEKIAIIREQRAQARQQQTAAASAPAMAETAKTMADTNTQDKNALTDVMRQLTGSGG